MGKEFDALKTEGLRKAVHGTDLDFVFPEQVGKAEAAIAWVELAEDLETIQKKIIDCEGVDLYTGTPIVHSDLAERERMLFVIAQAGGIGGIYDVVREQMEYYCDVFGARLKV